MKFGLLYEMHTPPGRSESDIFWEAIEQVKLAEEVGFDYVWAVEHHFMPDFASSSSPEIFLTAVAQHTTRMRVGFGVCLLPYPFNHPFRVAERAATIDILSKGRLDVGTGRALSIHELAGFGIDPDDSRDMWDEAIRVIPRMWTEPEFSGFEGKHLSIPPRAVVPRPVQDPHPPLWMACTSPTSFEIAGRYGLGTLSFAFGGPKTLTEVLERRAEARKKVQPVAGFINDEIAAFTILHCRRDDAKAIREGAVAAVQYQEKFLTKLGPVVMTKGYQEWRSQFPDPELFSNDVSFDEIHRFTEEMVAQSALAIGDPSRLTNMVHEFAAEGATQVLGIVQFGELPHEDVMETIRLFGEEVIQRHFR